MIHLEDHDLPGNWNTMTDAQRAASATDDGNLHWTGANVDANKGFLTSGISGGHVQMYAPNPVEGGSSVSHFDTDLTPNDIMEPITTPDRKDNIGLARFLLQDIGWQIFTNNTPIISIVNNFTLKSDATKDITFCKPLIL